MVLVSNKESARILREDKRGEGDAFEQIEGSTTLVFLLRDERKVWLLDRPPNLPVSLSFY